MGILTNFSCGPTFIMESNKTAIIFVLATNNDRLDWKSIRKKKKKPWGTPRPFQDRTTNTQKDFSLLILTTEVKHKGAIMSGSRDLRRSGSTDGVEPYLGRRLHHWRIANGIKGYEMSKIIGISQGSLSDLLNEKAHPSANTLAKIHNNTTLNIIWLLTNKGKMEKEI